MEVADSRLEELEQENYYKIKQLPNWEFTKDFKPKDDQELFKTFEDLDEKFDNILEEEYEKKLKEGKLKEVAL